MNLLHHILSLIVTWDHHIYVITNTMISLFLPLLGASTLKPLSITLLHYVCPISQPEHWLSTLHPRISSFIQLTILPDTTTTILMKFHFQLATLRTAYHYQPRTLTALTFPRCFHTAPHTATTVTSSKRRQYHTYHLICHLITNATATTSSFSSSSPTSLTRLFTPSPYSPPPFFPFPNYSTPPPSLSPSSLL